MNFADTDGRDFVAVFDFDTSTVTLRSRFFVATQPEVREATAAAHAYNRAAADYKGWHVRFDVQARLVSYPQKDGKRLPVKDYQVTLQEIATVPNFYANASDPRAHNVGGDKFTGGRTQGAYEQPVSGANDIVMNMHDREGDMGTYVDAVKHEMAHTFGLDDTGHRNIDRYYVRGGITDYDHLTAVRGNRPMAGADYASIGVDDIRMIMRFVEEYDPSNNDVHSRAFIAYTPHILVRRIEGGAHKDYPTFDAMWADHVNDFTTRALKDVEQLDALSRQMSDTLLQRLK